MNKTEQRLVSKVETAISSGDVCELNQREWATLQHALNKQLDRWPVGEQFEWACEHRALLLGGVRLRREYPKGMPTVITPKARKKRRR